MSARDIMVKQQVQNSLTEYEDLCLHD